jgi:hypothetical protein
MVTGAATSATRCGALLMDSIGNRGARAEIDAVKAVAARAAGRIIDQVVQIVETAGLTGDMPSPISICGPASSHVDGPDPVELRTMLGSNSGAVEHQGPAAIASSTPSALGHGHQRQAPSGLH